MKSYIDQEYTKREERNYAPPAKVVVLDPAQAGHILGAFGTIEAETHPHQYRGWLKKLMAFLVVMGPGLIVMIGDNDAGGVATYAQAGQNYGTSLLWTLLVLMPVLIVNQEMVARLGAVTGVGHARMIFERFGKFWGYFSVGDLFLLNFLTIITEFIGVSMALSFFGVSRYISVPLAALALIIITVTGSFKRWERFMFGVILFSFLMFPLAFLTHPSWSSVVHDIFIPGIKGGLNSTSLLLIIGIVGTTVAPWQLFFQQSNVVDKRITPRWLNHERLDTIFGSFLTTLGGAALIIIAAFGFGGSAMAGKFTDMSGVISGLSALLDHGSGAMMAVVLFDAAILGAAAVTLATSYAFGDLFRKNHSLHQSFKDARFFYISYSIMIFLAGAVVLIPNAPLGLITLAVQALAGILLPSATVFLVLLCNDKHILGPWVNSRWMNAMAAVIVGLLVMLSFILAATTLFPGLDATQLTVWSALGFALTLSVMGVFFIRGNRARKTKTYSEEEKMEWRMPPLEKLPQPEWSITRKVGMYTLRGYLIVASGLMVVKVIQLATLH